MSSADKPANNKLGTRFNWQPTPAAPPAQSAVARLTTAPASVPPVVTPADNVALAVPAGNSDSAAVPVSPSVSPVAQDLNGEWQQLSAHAATLRWWAILSTLVCLMVLISWLV